jgi:acyl-[acyl-carrier-protein]-phospholipid O-acyltransferase/long-chain-fatty-acid--[acyl-carrier-protein] ligase
MPSGSTPLLLSRRFAPLFWTQFFSAFSDNFLKNALVFLILFRVQEGSEALITLAAAVFIAPFFFLSGLGGELADRYDKALVAQRLKLVEIAVGALAVLGFYLHSIPILFVALFLFGVIAALFGPIKYGILPDHLARSELPAGNALVEGATFMAILLGTVVGGMAAKGAGDPGSFAALMMVFAVLCWGASLFIPRTGEGAPELVVQRNIVASTLDLLRHLRSQHKLLWGALVVSWFWLVGAVVLSLLPALVKNVIAGSEDEVYRGFLSFLAVFAVFIALGSLLAAWLAAGRIILLPTVLGALVIGIFAIDLGLAGRGGAVATTFGAFFSTGRGIRITIDLAGLALGGGLFVVPVFTALQAWAGVDHRARVIAANNVLNAAFMVLGTLLIALLQFLGVSAAMLFVLIGVMTLAVAVAVGLTMPTHWVSDFLSIVFRAFFRVQVKGLENMQKGGPNPIIALNHVSFLDAPLAVSLLGRDAAFAIDSEIAKRWWVKPFLRFGRAMPLDPTKPMATRALINAVRGGESLVIFPEGRITVTGSLMKVYDGAGLIADKSDAMVIPVRIEGLEATPFSRLARHQVRRRWFPKVTVTVLEPVKLQVDPDLRGKKRRQAAGAALYQIMSNLVFSTTSTERTVIEALIDAAKVHGMHHVIVEDSVSGALTYRRLLMATRILGEKLMALAEEGKPVGVMLPNANGAVVTLFALMSGGRVPAMINFSAGSANILAACKAAQLTTIATSRAFIERGKLGALVATLEPHVRFVYLEDVRRRIGILDKVRGLLNAKKPLVARKAEDWAAILFTSGSEGVPKGVVLSHRNMLANAAQAAARIDFGRSDKVFNVLPMFHSFGLTIGVVLPIVSGVRIFLYPSPLHYRTVPELIYAVNATIMFGTDTFLNGYARSAHAYDFRSLRYILAGAEPVRESTRRLYLEKFGLRILEGYGVTETAPALALNTPMFNKFGSVGRLLPGMELRLAKVEGVEDGGRLYVKGPNVMLGYLKAENPGVLEPPPQGWHDTGDIVSLDEHGFITIKGRAKRFAKIGGEMVSLAAVEMLASELWPDALSAVASVPDLRKGERLILFTQQQGGTRSEFMNFARSKGASELMVPAEVVVMERLPVLGSGKIDNVALTNHARERAAAKPTVVADQVLA